MCRKAGQVLIGKVGKLRLEIERAVRLDILQIKVRPGKVDACSIQLLEETKLVLDTAQESAEEAIRRAFVWRRRRA